MNYLIRAAGHSISKDPKSDKNCCILHGKRKDNGDVWTSMFSIDDAKKAGIYKNTWEKYGEDMIFARALSRLARQLFPDVLKGAYTEGEVRDGVIDNPRPGASMKVEQAVEVISSEKASDLVNLMKKCDNNYIETLYKFLSKPEYGVESISDLPISMYERVKAGIIKNIEENTIKIEKLEITKEEKEEIVDGVNICKVVLAQWLVNEAVFTMKSASESAAVMGISPWMTAEQLFLEKTGQCKPRKTNYAMQRGLDLEEEARKCFEHITDYIVFPKVVISKCEIPMANGRAGRNDDG